VPLLSSLFAWSFSQIDAVALSYLASLSYVDREPLEALSIIADIKEDIVFFFSKKNLIIVVLNPLQDKEIYA